jgi:hypothetical protein
MKETKQTLKIFILSSPVVATEIFALSGDKYKNALPFRWEMTSDFTSAQIVIWDGVITLRNQAVMRSIISKMTAGKVLLFLNGSSTFLRENPTAKVMELDKVPLVEVKGRNILPEELISALEACQKKLSYV